jgi:hypothetical protein
VLAIHHADDDWIDLLIGPPRMSGLFCILTTKAALPLTTDIPYNMEAEFVRQAKVSLGLNPDVAPH